LHSLCCTTIQLPCVEALRRRSGRGDRRTKLHVLSSSLFGFRLNNTCLARFGETQHLPHLPLSLYHAVRRKSYGTTVDGPLSFTCPDQLLCRCCLLSSRISWSTSVNDLLDLLLSLPDCGWPHQLERDLVPQLPGQLIVIIPCRNCSSVEDLRRSQHVRCFLCVSFSPRIHFARSNCFNRTINCCNLRLAIELSLVDCAPLLVAAMRLLPSAGNSCFSCHLRGGGKTASYSQ